MSSERGIERSRQFQRVRARLFLDPEDHCRLGVMGPFATLQCLADAHLARSRTRIGPGVPVP